MKLILIFICLEKVLIAGATGGQPAQFINFGAAARTFGMAKAFYSISDDASAPYFNPAGLAQIYRNEITALHCELYPGTDTQYDYLSFVYPTVRYGIFGVSIARLYSSKFQRVKVEVVEGEIVGLEIGEDTFDNTEFALISAYGKRLLENLLIGVSFKYITRRLDYHRDSIFTFDIGTLFEGFNSKLPLLRFAFGVKNLLSQSFNTLDKLPIILRFGVSNRFLKKRLIVAFDLEKNINANPNWFLGIEYWAFKFIALRVGLDGEIGIRETSAGFGFEYKDYSFDYAFSLHELGLSHRISGSWRFGRPVHITRENLLKSYLEEAKEYVRIGEFLLAFNKLEKALEIEPRDKKIKESHRKLQIIVSFIPKSVEDTDVASGIRKCVVSYLAEDIQGAIDALKYAYYKDPKNMKIHSLLNTLEKEAGVMPTPIYREEIVGWTIIDKKMYQARQAILDGEYEKALSLAQEVLKLEPKNTTALELMGSAFFMMNEMEKAKEYWKKVLEIDPTNKVVPVFLEQIE